MEEERSLGLAFEGDCCLSPKTHLVDRGGTCLRGFLLGEVSLSFRDPLPSLWLSGVP